ncbi:hypothetical protein QOZ80_3BG0256020 [Eleusine coracana subsp. coracana]|nr:hypothetical protein QOZ80_3BG0256020 [Eleusine coracana subsp. coracana]
MSHRRFLNFVVQNYRNGLYSLRRLDLWRHRLFFPNADGATTDLKKLIFEEMESFKVPAPSVRFYPNPSPAIVDLPYRVHSFGLSESKIICTDNSGLSFLYDAGRRAFVTMPSLHAPKKVPISFAVPPNDKDGGGGLYVMEQVPYPHYTQKGLFEVFVNTSSESRPFYSRSPWQCHSLPPPPFVLDPGFKGARIDTYAVLGGGSHLCISSQGVGTYCFGTASREWSRAGNWTLPFYVKAEYIPELNLWFGLSDKDLHPCASDLSSVARGAEAGAEQHLEEPVPA